MGREHGHEDQYISLTCIEKKILPNLESKWANFDSILFLLSDNI